MANCVYYKGDCRNPKGCTWCGTNNECRWHGVLIPTTKKGEDGDLLQLGITKSRHQYLLDRELEALHYVH
jgi:hypothetical protein